MIYPEGEHPTPREYVDRTLLPLSTDLFEALADACALRQVTISLRAGPPVPLWHVYAGYTGTHARGS